MVTQNEHGLGAGVEVDFEPNVNPVCGPGEGQVGAAQRLRIAVPNVYTQMTLGQALGGDDAQGFAYAGFGVSTEGNIYQRADLTATYQSQGHTNIHAYGTGSDVYLGANRKVAISAATENVFVAGGGGVMISGGVPWHPFEHLGEQGDQTVETPKWLTATTDTADDLKNLWSFVDAAAAGLGVVLSAKRKQLSIAETKATKGWNWVNAVINLLNIAGNAGLDPFNGTTIHGHSGLILGTFGTMGIYSGAGTGLMSAVGVQMLAPSVAMEGALDAAVQSRGKTSIMGGQALEVIGGKTVEISSRNEDVQILAQAIFVGGPPAETGASQKKANKFEVNAESVVVNAVEHDTSIDNAYRVDAKDLSLGCGNLMNFVSGSDLQMIAPKMELRAIDKLSMHVPGGMGVQVKKSELFIGKNTATPPFDAGAVGKGKRGKQKSRAVAKAKAEWAKKVAEMTAGDVGIKFKSAKITLSASGYDVQLDSGKLKVANALICKK